MGGIIMGLKRKMDNDLQKLFLQKYKSKIASTRGRKDSDGKEIEVKLSLEEFTNLYLEAGVLPMAPYVISRIGDKGDYEIGNVFISTNAQNSLDAHGIEDTILTTYCYQNKYKRRIVKNALKAGRLTWDDVLNNIPIRL